jgi:hypothetical protein
LADLNREVLNREVKRNLTAGNADHESPLFNTTVSTLLDYNDSRRKTQNGWYWNSQVSDIT